MKLATLLKEILLLEYSEKVYKELIDRYKKQNRNLDEDNIRYYITRFSQILPNIRQRIANNDEALLKLIPKELQEKNKFVDITLWRRFEDLEKIIDSFPTSKSQQKKAQEQSVNDADTDADEIYTNDNIEVYKGDTMHRCIKYGKSEKYSWCISRIGDTRSMYYNYRFMGGESRSFYFVFDRNRSSEAGNGGFKDPFHAFVIHVFERDKYSVTDANNNGDKPANKWEDIGKIIPNDIWNKIKGQKDLFKYIPPSAEESELQALKGKTLTVDQFSQLSYKTKTTYVQNNAVSLSTDIFKSLDLELKNMAINYGRACSFSELKSNQGLLKRYPDYRFTRFPDQPIPYVFIPYLKTELQREYYDKFEAEYLTFDEIEEFFDKSILTEYIKKQIGNLDFLPKDAEKYMTPEQLQTYSVYSDAFADLEYILAGSKDREEQSAAPNRWVNISPISYNNARQSKTFGNYINLIYKKLGTKLDSIDKYNAIFLGAPQALYINGKLYFIFSKIPNNSYIGEGSFIITDESLSPVLEGITSFVIKNKGKELYPYTGQSIVAGKSTTYLTDKDFTELVVDGENGNKVLTPQDFGKLQEQFDINQYQFRSFKHKAGII